MREAERRRSARSRLAIALALASILVLALSAGLARAEPVAKGKTRLILSRPIAAALHQGRLRIGKLKQARVQGRSISLPIEGGELDVSSGAGSVSLEGGMRIAAGSRSATLSALRLDTSERALWSELDGRRLKLASFGRYTVERVGFGDEIDVAALKLSRPAAAQLGAKLGLTSLFRAGAPLGSLTSSLKPQYDSLAKGSLQLTLDPSTLARLKAVGVGPQPFEALTVAVEPPSYAASLTSGAVYPDLRGGSAAATAGLRLRREAPATVVSWLGLTVSLESNKLFADTSLAGGAGNSSRGVVAIAALDLSGATARVDPKSRTVTITGIRATLEAAAAALLNEAFASAPGQRLVAAGETLGEISLWMTGR